MSQPAREVAAAQPRLARYQAPALRAEVVANFFDRAKSFTCLPG